MSTEAGQQPTASQEAPTENQGSRVPSEISSLSNYMARQQPSSGAGSSNESGGEGSPDTASAESQQGERSQYIPRERFDQVLNERNQLRQQTQQQPQPQPQQQQPQTPQLNTGMQPGFAPQAPQQQPGVGPTGMVGRQPQPQQRQQPNVPDFSDPQVQKEWRQKIQNNPVTGLREFVSLMIQAEGTPLLEQYQQQITSQLTPLQQTFAQQQLTQYHQQRSQQDPSFQQIAPQFTQLAQQAQQRGYTLTPDVMQAIEGIARSQAGLFNQPQPQQQQVPFSEQPGGTGSFGQKEPPQLTNQERAIAERFGMSPEEYVAQRGN